MIDDLKTARDYLNPPRDAFWEWRDDAGEVATWIDGRTIVFRAELVQVLEHLAPNGLPALAPLLMLLSATRDSGEELNERGILASCLKRSYKAWKHVDTLNNVMEGLRAVSQLDPALRSTTMAKAVLAEVVFEGLGEIASAKEANAIVGHMVGRLGQGMGEVLDAPPGAVVPRYEPSALLHDLRCLQMGLKRVDAETLRLRRTTGLDQAPGAADLELPPAARIRKLLANLKEDSELQGLAQLAMNLMAAVTLPRAIAEEDELQVGGVSDIANRGPLDRLLLSELAHDDLTLAVRVAVNEAMYLRRESPPRTPPQQRALLLECGIRSWGIPRIFSTAVALALSCTTEANTEIVAFRAKRDGVARVDLTTREGVVDHLAALEPDLHPGRSLDAFAFAMSESKCLAEPVLVTTDDVMTDRDFQRMLVEQDALPMHIATVNRGGEFRLFEQTLRGRKLLRHATLDLDGLLRTKNREATVSINRDWADKLPAIFRAEPFPLLLSHNVNPNRTWRIDPFGALSITSDRRLMLWTHSNEGGRQLSDQMPQGALLWRSMATAEGEVLAVVGQLRSGDPHIVEVDVEERTCLISKLEVSDRSIQCICGHNGALFAIGKRSIDVLSASSGSLLHELKMPPALTWLRDRFFYDHRRREFYGLSFDGRTGRLELIPISSVLRGQDRQMVTFFDRQGVDGPIGITQAGNLYSSATESLRTLPTINPRPSVEAIAADGSKIVVKKPPLSRTHGDQYDVVDVDKLTTSTAYCEPHLLAESFGGIVCPRGHRNRFICVYADSSGALRLVSRKQHHLTIHFDSQSNCIRLQAAQFEHGAEKQTFSPVPGLVVGYNVSVATWGDGSRAYLDSRGLLHLQSSDRSVPEASIVLADGELSGWCSDGRFWGFRYLIGDQTSAPKEEIYNSAIRAFVEQLR